MVEEAQRVSDDEYDPRLLKVRLDLLDMQIAQLLHNLSVTAVSLGEIAKGLTGNVEFTNAKISLPEIVRELDETRSQLRAMRHTLAPGDQGT